MEPREMRAILGVGMIATIVGMVLLSSSTLKLSIEANPLCEAEPLASSYRLRSLTTELVWRPCPSGNQFAVFIGRQSWHQNFEWIE